jgi:phage baseplate assembly protein W
MAAINRADKYTVNSKLQVKFSDFTSEFTSNPATGDLYKNVNDFAIKESLKNLILTEQGERMFQPTLGGTIRRSLFGQLDEITVTRLRSSVEMTIKNHEPRVVFRDISVVTDDDRNNASLTIFYSTINSPGQIQDLTVNFLTRVR